jgi:hypothetical protein
MATKRRQVRKRQTRRRRQAGGGTEEDYEIIRTIYAHNGDPGAMIAAIYTTKALYNKCTEYPPASQLGKGQVIPVRYARPKGMKPLNSVLRCAYNMFDIYAGKARGSESERAEWEMARQLCMKLKQAFQTFTDADYDPETRMGPSKGKQKKADNLFERIGQFIYEMSGAKAERERANFERRARAVEAERMEAGRARMMTETRRTERSAASTAPATSAAPCGGAGCNTRNAAAFDPMVVSAKNAYLAGKGPVEFW